MITDSQSLEGKTCCAGIHGGSGFPDSQCVGCCSQPGSGIAIGLGTDLLDGRSNSCNTSEILLHVDLNLDPSEDLGYQKPRKAVATSRMEGSLSSSCVVSRGGNFGVNPLDMSLDHMSAKSCIPGSIRGSTSFVQGHDRRDRLLGFSACADSFQFKQKRTQNEINLNSSGSIGNAIQQDKHFVSDAQTSGKSSLDSAILEERSRETSLKQNSCVYKRRKVRHSETLLPEHMKTPPIKETLHHIGNFGSSSLTQLEKNQIETDVNCKRQDKSRAGGPESLYPEKNAFPGTYLNGKRDNKKAIASDQTIDSENDGNFSEEEILKRDDKKCIYAIHTSNIVMQPGNSVENKLCRRLVNENCLGNLDDYKVHTLSFFSDSDRKDINNENGIENTCESSFTREYCTAFPDQCSPSLKKLTCKMGRIMDTNHGEICGSGACASFCLDAAEVGEERDLEREWCISILKDSKLLALSSGNSAAMEHPGVVGDGKCNKKCKVCGALEDSTSTLICDMCEESFHMSCCNPRVISIPMKDNWYCPACRRKRKRPVVKSSIESRENDHGLKFKRGVADKVVHDKGAEEKGGDLLWRMLQDDGAYTTQVRIGNEYQADVPLWTGKVTDSVESPFMGELISLEEKILEQEFAKPNMEKGVWPKDWKPAKPFFFGYKENWLQCRAVLYYEGEVCPDGRKAKQDIICGKWRRAPLSQVQKDEWDCSCAVVWDPVHADCAVPQEMETEDIIKVMKANEMVLPECKLSKEDWGFEKDEQAVREWA